MSAERSNHRGTLALSWGPWGGFYFIRGFMWRLCFGWAAITWCPVELDDLCEAYAGPEKLEYIDDVQDVMSGRRLAVARLVTKSWSDAAMRWGSIPMEGRTSAHPLGCVLAALDGETDPIELGIAPTDDYYEPILQVGGRINA